MDEAAQDKPHHGKPIAFGQVRAVLLNDAMGGGKNGDASGGEAGDELKGGESIRNIVFNLALESDEGMRRGVLDESSERVHGEAVEGGACRPATILDVRLGKSPGPWSTGWSTTRRVNDGGGCELKLKFSVDVARGSP